MKIALLTYSTKPRGSVIHTIELATALAKRGHQVCVFALAKDRVGFERPLPCAIRLIPAEPAPADIDGLIQQRIQEFAHFLPQEPQAFDIYHAQDCIGANALLQLRQRGQIPHFVRTVHHIEDFQSPYLRQCQNQSIQAPDLCLCVSRRWQQVLKADYAIDAQRVVNGVNLGQFSPTPSGDEYSLQQRYGLVGSPRYLTVGGIEPRKNSLCLLTAFVQVLERYPQAQLIIAGGATLFDYQDYRNCFFAQAKTLDIQIGRSLILPGVIPTNDLVTLYRCADVFCFPSVTEGWGLVVLEAIASGLPVVVSQQPPFTEFLAPDQALWADPEQPASIAQAMIQALQPEGQSIIERSRSILSKYSWQHSAQLHEECYQQLLQSGP